MRRPRLRRNRPLVLDLGDLRTLRHRKYLIDGRPHVLERWTSDSDGSVSITLVDEAVYVERHAAREERRSLAELIRRWRERPDRLPDPDPAAPPER